MQERDFSRFDEWGEGPALTDEKEVEFGRSDSEKLDFLRLKSKKLGIYTGIRSDYLFSE